MAQGSKPRIAIVEDDSILCFMMTEMCKSAGFEVVGCVGDGLSALDVVNRSRPDYLILDFNLDGEWNGLELIEKAKKTAPGIGTVLVTAWDINDIASRMEGEQPNRILRKPVPPHVLVEVIDHMEALRQAGSQPAIAIHSGTGGSARTH